MKTCGSCNLCCKIVAVETLSKPGGKWCVHAKPGKGCSIYGEHPEECQRFRCGWLQDPNLGDDWKPTVSGFVMRAEIGGRRLCVDVDVARPDAWRDPRYYPTLKVWSQAAWSNQGHVVVYIGSKAVVMFPEEEVEVGDFFFGEDLAVGYKHGPHWRQPAVRLKRHDGSVLELLGSKYSI